MIYRAFLNRQEITGFPVDGIETTEIYGGNTLFWKKGNAPSTGFTLTITDGLTYYVPPSSFYIALKQIELYPLDLEIDLNRNNIEFGFWGEDQITENGSTQRVSSYAYLLCKAKTEELKKNIDKIFFYTLDYDGKEGDLPLGGPGVNPDAYKKVGSKIVLSDNVFSLETYSTSNIGNGGIQFFNLRNFNTSIGGYNPGIGAGITGSGALTPILHSFDTKEELMAWAVS